MANLTLTGSITIGGTYNGLTITNGSVTGGGTISATTINATTVNATTVSTTTASASTFAGGIFTGTTFNGATLDNTAWTTFTPTITAGTGTFTTVSGTGRYKQIGKSVFFSSLITCTTVGSAANWVVMTLPVTANTTVQGAACGRELATNGSALICTIISSTQLQILYYNVTFPGGSGNLLNISGVYEAA